MPPEMPEDAAKMFQDGGSGSSGGGPGGGPGGCPGPGSREGPRGSLRRADLRRRLANGVRQVHETQARSKFWSKNAKNSMENARDGRPGKSEHSPAAT